MGWHLGPAQRNLIKSVSGLPGCQVPCCLTPRSQFISQAQESRQTSLAPDRRLPSGSKCGGWGWASVKMTRKMTGGASPTRESGEALFRSSHCLDRADFNLVEGCVRTARWEKKLFLFPLCTVISWATDHMPCLSHVPGSQQASVEE